MAQNITISVKKMVAEANSEITTISVEEASQLISSPDHVIIDLRDIRELQRSGKIPGAFSCPRGMLEFWVDPASPYEQGNIQSRSNMYFIAPALGGLR